MNTLLNQHNTRTASTSAGSFSEVLNFNRSQLAGLKAELLGRFGAEYPDVENHLIRQAVNEADSLASQTTIPQLVFLTLAEEKLQSLRQWSAKQRAMLSPSILAVAA